MQGNLSGTDGLTTLQMPHMPPPPFLSLPLSLSLSLFFLSLSLSLFLSFSLSSSLSPLSFSPSLPLSPPLSFLFFSFLFLFFYCPFKQNWYEENGVLGNVFVHSNMEEFNATNVVELHMKEYRVGRVSLRFQHPETGETCQGKTNPHVIMRNVTIKPGQVFR